MSQNSPQKNIFNIATNRLKAKMEQEYRDEINYLKSRNRLQETPGIYRLF